MPYQKPYLTIPQQRGLLESRGMTIPDHAKADEYLRRIGYYRLSAYWYPFRKLIEQPDGTYVLGNDFKAGTTFKHATDLYAFDKGLRLITLDAIERIEVSVRTEVALSMGRHGAKAHRNPDMLDRNFISAKPPHKVSRYSEWIERLDRKEAESKEEFAGHFRTKYADDKMPIWIAVELLDFGPLSILLSGMRYSDLQIVAVSYGLEGYNGPKLIKSWIRSLSSLRNVCAHHSRVWNKPLIDQPTIPDPGQYPELDHLPVSPGTNRRPYAALAIIRFLLKRVNPRTKWTDRLKAHMATFPDAPNIKLSDAGFPDDWAKLPLWT